MFYLVFKPQRKQSGERVRYDYRSQAFIGFTESFDDAVKLACDKPEANYQIYECEQPTLDFRRNEAVRFGFRKHYGSLVMYRRTPNGQEELIKNPLESSEEEQKRLSEIQRKRLEGVQKRIQELQEIEQQIKQDQ